VCIYKCVYTLRVCRALLSAYRALLSAYRALLSAYRALLSAYRAFIYMYVVMTAPMRNRDASPALTSRMCSSCVHICLCVFFH